MTDQPAEPDIPDEAVDAYIAAAYPEVTLPAPLIRGEVRAGLAEQRGAATASPALTSLPRSAPTP